MISDNPTVNEVIEYVKEYYNAEPELLWEKYPGDAVFRHIGNKKWFALILLNTPKEKLGISGQGKVDILDLKCDPNMIGNLLDCNGYLPGYHMNKEHWITILLDGSVPVSEIFGLIDLSFDLTGNRKK